MRTLKFVLSWVEHEKSFICSGTDFSFSVLWSTQWLLEWNNEIKTLKIHFLISRLNICCGYSKEPSWWDGSFEHLQQMLLLIDKEIITTFQFFFQINLKRNIIKIKLPVAHNAMKVCACFFMTSRGSFSNDNLHKIWSKKSWGVTADKSHFNLLRSNDSMSWKKEACLGVLGIQDICHFTFRDIGYYPSYFQGYGILDSIFSLLPGILNI